MLRFAPSPTGDLHIGNLRVALFNYLLAKKLKRPLLLRIEDTDLERNIENKDKDILDLLDSFGLSFDSYSYQSDNFPIHRDLALKLVKEGKAFYCYCSKEFLESKREEATNKKIAFRYDDSWSNLEKGNKTSSPIIRLRGGVSISFRDCIHGVLSFPANEIDSFVIMRNEIPTYNFACSVDDRDASLILRGQDHLSNTPKQILVKRALGFSEAVEYAHLPMLLNEEGKKLSKRDQSSSVSWLLSQGIEPSALANYLILLGNSKLEQILGEVFGYEECWPHFELGQLSRAPAHIDYKKKRHLNRNLLRKTKKPSDFYPALEAALLACSPDSPLENLKVDSRFDSLVSLYLGEVSTASEVVSLCALAFSPLAKKREKAVGLEAEFDLLVSLLKGRTSFEDFKDMKESLARESKLKGRGLFKPLRLILSGQDEGVELERLFAALRIHLPFIMRID